MRTTCKTLLAATLVAATACGGAKAPADDSAAAASASAAATPAVAAPIDTAKADTLKALPDTNERRATPASKPVVAPPVAARDSFRKPKFQVDEKTGKVEPIKKP